MWYYIEDGQQRGPVLDADLETLRRDKKINAETMVWREGMANWQPLSEVQTGAPSNSNPSNAASSDAATGSTHQVVCSQCGGLFPAGEVIRYGNAAVCGACKPVFVQKLKEGAAITSGVMEYAGFWTRFAAYFLDGILTGLLGMVVGAIIGAAWGASGGLKTTEGMVTMQLASGGAGLLIRALYFIYFIGKSGQTPGKKLCKVRVVNPDGSPVGYGKATGRFFGYMLSGLILCFGFLMAAWDGEKRALHDRLCNTRVIKA